MNCTSLVLYICSFVLFKPFQNEACNKTFKSFSFCHFVMKYYDYLGDDFLNSRYAMFCQPIMNETCELKVRRSCKVVQGARCTSHCEQCLWLCSHQSACISFSRYSLIMKGLAKYHTYRGYYLWEEEEREGG